MHFYTHNATGVGQTHMPVVRLLQGAYEGVAPHSPTSTSPGPPHWSNMAQLSEWNMADGKDSIVGLFGKIASGLQVILLYICFQKLY